MFVFVMLLCVLLTVRWLRCVVAAAAAVATLLRSFEWILRSQIKFQFELSGYSQPGGMRISMDECYYLASCTLLSIKET